PDLGAVTVQLTAKYEIPDYKLDSSGGLVGGLGLGGVFGLDDLVDEANGRFLDGEVSIDYRLNSAGRFVKPAEWNSRRAHPGKLQEAGLGMIAAEQRLERALEGYRLAESQLADLTRLANNVIVTEYQKLLLKADFRKKATALGALAAVMSALESKLEGDGGDAMLLGQIAAEGFPRVVGLSNDATSAGRVGVLMAGFAAKETAELAGVIASVAAAAAEVQLESLEAQLGRDIAGLNWNREYGQLLHSVRVGVRKLLVELEDIDQASFKLQQAEERRRALEARGIAIQSRREVFRKRAAAVVQGYRTRDLAFRVFRNEALEKYKALFDLSARYTFLAARAYDYETGLLDGSGNGTAAAFYESIVQSRALGVLDGNGNPQFTSSTTGDPGLAGVLAAMEGDWGVAETRLGFNNPDNYETSFSLRQEQFRIVPADTGDGAWKDVLSSFREANVLDDPDVRRYCMQISNQRDLPIPGLVIPFQTTIADGVNFFGQPLAGGDSTFSPTSFATKIRSSGISFKGYIGMESPTSTSGSIGGAGGSSPPDPDLGFLDPQALSATPYVYLIPAGIDSMRSPPLGDVSAVRRWTVADQSIPLPFNIGNSDFSTSNSFVSADSLSEPPFQIRKHQAFRAVPSGTVFGNSDGFTNNRLIGRSVWNSQWKLVIPGKTLRANPDVGLDVFLETVTDIELFLKTYSYSGN
ncbi:MAG: hypothetical protein P8J87_14765, partial [Verrucomicrobiales bacterium]|nr:hypothetical protein [Verrucomicrobiales bacterium]